MFTKQHYKEIADIIKDCDTEPQCRKPINAVDLAHKLADYFEQDNPLFNRVKWFNYLNG